MLFLSLLNCKNDGFQLYCSVDNYSRNVQRFKICCFILIWIFICILHDENTLQMLKSGAINQGKKDSFWIVWQHLLKYLSSLFPLVMIFAVISKTQQSALCRSASPIRFMAWKVSTPSCWISRAIWRRLQQANCPSTTRSFISCRTCSICCPMSTCRSLSRPSTWRPTTRCLWSIWPRSSAL